jgi:hypothetical protein
MKTVPWFVLKQFDGSPIKMPNGVDATLKDVLLLQIGGAQIKDGKKAIAAYIIGTKIYALKDGEDLMLEDEEFNVMKDAIESNPPQNAVIWGQIWQKLIDAKEGKTTYN